MFKTQSTLWINVMQQQSKFFIKKYLKKVLICIQPTVVNYLENFFFLLKLKLQIVWGMI